MGVVARGAKVMLTSFWVGVLTGPMAGLVARKANRALTVGSLALEGEPAVSAQLTVATAARVASSSRTRRPHPHPHPRPSSSAAGSRSEGRRDLIGPCALNLIEVALVHVRYLSQSHAKQAHTERSRAQPELLHPIAQAACGSTATSSSGTQHTKKAFLVALTQPRRPF